MAIPLYLAAFEVSTTVPSLVHSTTGGGLAAGGSQGKYINEPSVTLTISVAGVGMFQSLPNARHKKQSVTTYSPLIQLHSLCYHKLLHTITSCVIS